MKKPTKTQHPALPVVLAVAISTLRCHAADAADATPAESVKVERNKENWLEEVVVTGSLIPQQLRVETSTPLTTITAEEIQKRGFAGVTEALQRASFSTGSAQGPQYSGGFTQSAQTLSMFGLSTGYVKYLIDGRPMADYPALYNGTDIIASISSIPTVLVDHVDVLPGGQSSIYGSDAIAGVVNIVLKKKMATPEIDMRIGFSKDGGGTQKRLAVADSFDFRMVNITAGAQYEKIDPIWGYQRELTSRYYTAGSSPQTAERDYLVVGFDGTYQFEDPANCANLTGQFGGSLRRYSRAGRGDYCGTTNAGYYTIGNGGESTQGLLRVTADVTEGMQIFADALLSHDLSQFSTGGQFFTTDEASSPFYYYYDPNIDDHLNWQRIFSPEDIGGLDKTFDSNTNSSIRATLGLQGSFGTTGWTYVVDMTHTENKLTERRKMPFTSAINNFFAPLFGPSLGIDPDFGTNIYTPDYAAFYQPITPADYASFTGQVTSHSRTQDNLARGQLTNAALFDLPGGDAGIAVVLEGGNQGWSYVPDERLLNGEAYLHKSTPGAGHRSRYAATTEVRLPILKMLTTTVSGRYDNYKVVSGHFDKATYNLGVEFRPVKSLLLRGRYGTAFKAPTLSDEYQGQSGFYQYMTDYYSCAVGGYAGATLSDCPDYQQSNLGTTSGNVKLKPTNAKVWDLGAVWAPLERMVVSVDFLNWKINDEVTQQSADSLLLTESLCRLGSNDINSPTCVAALSQVTRDSNNVLQSVATPKINASVEALGVLNAKVAYRLMAGRLGDFEFEAVYSDVLKHEYRQYEGDATLDLLNEPTWSTEFKTKGNVSVTWDKANFSTTVYVERYGRTPNYMATVSGYGTDGAGKLGAWTLANLSARYRLLPSLQLSVAVNNVFNTMPPADHSRPGTASQPYNELNYNVYGRSYFVGANYKFGR